MGHGEDEQPNESVRGRPKRVMPFVTNTSRGRGRGGSRGNHSSVEQGRGRGRGFSQVVSIVPGSSRSGHLQAYSGSPLSSTHSSITYLQPTPISGSHTSGVLTPGHVLPQKPQSTLEIDGSTKSSLDHLHAHVEAPISNSESLKRPRPRKRGWRPGTRGRFRKDAASQHDGAPAWEAHSSEQIRPDDGPSHTANELPPTKRPRLDGYPEPNRASVSMNTALTPVKSEAVDEPSVGSTQEQASSGTVLISYDKYPKCRFNCGRPPEEVRNNRKSVKGQEVAALLKKGLKVNNVFIRDDGIAIDWSLPTGPQTNAPAPPTIPSPRPAELDLLVPLSALISASYHDYNSTPPPSQKKLPSHLDPLATPAYNLPTQRPDTPTLTEIAYREIQIPTRHLPRRGDTRKLEIWVVEQMRLLEAELGSVLVPPPELIGVGECIRGQTLPDGIVPCVRIHYKRPVRALVSSQQVARQDDQGGFMISLNY